MADLSLDDAVGEMIQLLADRKAAEEALVAQLTAAQAANDALQLELADRYIAASGITTARATVVTRLREFAQREVDLSELLPPE